MVQQKLYNIDASKFDKYGRLKDITVELVSNTYNQRQYKPIQNIREITISNGPEWMYTKEDGYDDSYKEALTLFQIYPYTSSFYKMILDEYLDMDAMYLNVNLIYDNGILFTKEATVVDYHENYIYCLGTLFEGQSKEASQKFKRSLSDVYEEALNRKKYARFIELLEEE